MFDARGETERKEERRGESESEDDKVRLGCGSGKSVHKYIAFFLCFLATSAEHTSALLAICGLVNQDAAPPSPRRETRAAVAPHQSPVCGGGANREGKNGEGGGHAWIYNNESS